MNISYRIECLRREMAQENIDIYIVPSADYHGSEYVGEYFKTREYLTGFTGSAGTAVFTMDRAGLWTDGRYFIQAEEQLNGTEIQLFRMGEPDVDTVESFLEKELPEGGVIGFDGRAVELSAGDKYRRIAEKKAAVSRHPLISRTGSGKIVLHFPPGKSGCWMSLMPVKAYLQNCPVYGKR